MAYLKVTLLGDAVHFRIPEKDEDALTSRYPNGDYLGVLDVHQRRVWISSPR
jgi:hypothetical protein